MSGSGKECGVARREREWVRRARGWVRRARELKDWSDSLWSKAPSNSAPCSLLPGARAGAAGGRGGRAGSAAAQPWRVPALHGGAPRLDGGVAYCRLLRGRQRAAGRDVRKGAKGAKGESARRVEARRGAAAASRFDEPPRRLLLLFSFSHTQRYKATTTVHDWM